MSGWSSYLWYSYTTCNKYCWLSFCSVLHCVQARVCFRCCGPQAELGFMRAEVCCQPSLWCWRVKLSTDCDGASDLRCCGPSAWDKWSESDPLDCTGLDKNHSTFKCTQLPQHLPPAGLLLHLSTSILFSPGELVYILSWKPWCDAVSTSQVRSASVIDTSFVQGQLNQSLSNSSWHAALWKQ